MIKKAFLALSALVSAFGTMQGADTKWFTDARFGMFVHFGASSVLGQGEWVMYGRSIPRDKYFLLQDVFDPHAFSAKEWVATAKNAGMKYIIFRRWATSPPCGSCIRTAVFSFNRRGTYSISYTNSNAKKLQKEGIKLGFYYSLLDWSREDYQWETGRRSKPFGRTAPSDWNHYIEFMKAQLTELLTNYGDIAVIWFDGHWDQSVNQTDSDPNTIVDWHYDEIYGLIKKLQPNCLIANNHHINPLKGEDYQVFERDVPGENTAGYGGADVSTRLPLETCQTISDAWGFNITDTHYKPTKELVHLLVRTAGMGANLLLNVGPQPDGLIDATSTSRLREMGEWMSKNGQTIYGTTAGWLKPQNWGAITTKGKTHYIHVLDPSAGALALDIKGFKSAKLLTGEGKLGVSKNGNTVTFTLPEKPDAIDTIIEVRI